MAYIIGVDEPTKFGPGWEGAFLAGSWYSEYDDNNYFEIHQRFLVHPSVARTREAVEARLRAVLLDLSALPEDERTWEMSEPVTEDQEGVLYWSDVDYIDELFFLQHGLVPAYEPHVENDLDMDWDGDTILTVDPLGVDDDDDPEDDE